MCTTHTLQLEGPDHVGGQLLGVGQGHAHHPVGLCPPAGPILKFKKLKPLIPQVRIISIIILLCCHDDVSQSDRYM